MFTNMILMGAHGRSPLARALPENFWEYPVGADLQIRD
jgi:hypothetical protein